MNIASNNVILLSVCLKCGSYVRKSLKPLMQMKRSRNAQGPSPLLYENKLWLLCRNDWILYLGNKQKKSECYGMVQTTSEIMYTLRTSCEDFPELTQNTSGPAMLTMYLRWCVSPTWKISILLKFCSKFMVKLPFFIGCHHIDDGLLKIELGNKLT